MELGMGFEPTNLRITSASLYQTELSQLTNLSVVSRPLYWQNNNNK